MRLRYVAAAGPEAALAALAARLDDASGLRLERKALSPSLALWLVPGTPFLPGADGAAAAVGLMFDRASGDPLATLPGSGADPRRLAGSCWGAYVLFASRPDGGHVFARDPSGALGAFHSAAGPLDLYASDGALLAAADPTPFASDLDFVRHHLAFPFLRASRTGAQGVSEILPGTSRTKGPSGEKVTAFWSPWERVAEFRPIVDFDEAASTLRETICGAVPRLAGDSADIVVHLSGGLDSSIVAAALAAGGRRFRAVTFATRAPDGDERPHARQVADHLGVHLAELVEQDLAPAFAQMPQFSLRPPPNALLRPLHRALALHLALTGGDVVLDGAGGDNVFCFLNSASPALDAFGNGSGFIRALHDLAALHGTTLWAVARAAFRRARARRETWRRDPTFLPPWALAIEPERHPWLPDPVCRPRGRYEQVQSIVGIRHFLGEPEPGAPAMLHPLLSQPVMETCLRIPSWLWIRGGRDRAVARTAFRGLLPDPILARRSKGRLESMFMRGYMAGRAELDALLGDGRLAAEGLIDADSVRSYLRAPGQPTDPGYIRLLELASVETWLGAFPG